MRRVKVTELTFGHAIYTHVGECVLVAVGVGDGDEGEVELGGELGLLGELVDDEGGDGGRDPLAGVDAGLDPDIGGALAGAGDGDHLRTMVITFVPLIPIIRVATVGIVSDER